MTNPLRAKFAAHSLWAFPLLFTLAAMAVQVHVGAYATDRGQTGDEAAHFVTSLMLADYLGHLGNPIAFAKDYYVHLPRVAIGHWPPFFEMLQGLAFVLFGGSNAVAMALQAVIAGLMAGLPAALMARPQNILAGLLTGLIILLSQNILFLLDTDMADNLLGLLVFLSAWTWSIFYARPSAMTAAGFVAAMAAAILTKGTAIGLLALPPAYLLVKGDIGFFFRRRTLLAMVAILLFTAPWYVATYRLASQGWNYSWGAFTLVAAPFFAKALFADFGVPNLVGFGLGVVRALRRRSGAIDMAAFAVTAMVQFLFILIAPADLQSRYLVPVYPCAAMVAVWGLWSLTEVIFPRPAFAGSMTGYRPGSPADVLRTRGSRARAVFPIILVSVLVLLSIWQGFAPPHVESFWTGDAFARIAPRRNPLVLVSGGARFEGAMIATAAAADRGRFFYILRASKLLSSSDFMGNGYRQRFSSEADLKYWLLQNQIGWIVTDTSPDSMRYDHNVMLLTLMKNDAHDFRPVWQGARDDGNITVFQTEAAAAPPRNPAPLLAQQAPSGVP